MYDAHIDTELNDLRIRLIFIPLFGLIIPNVTGMIDNSAYGPVGLVVSYLYFMFISFAIWQGNRYLLFRIRPRFSWLNQPVQKIFALVLSNLFYTIPICVGLMVLWYAFAAHAAADWDVIFKATALCIICVVFITHTYETVYLLKQWESDKMKGEKLERSRVEAQLEALKNQVDPHFIFNSLNTLSHLIVDSPVKAREFNDHLADVYRYLLTNHERTLVLLREEREFLDNYFALLKIRFGSAIELEMMFPENELDRILLPPISLQVLAENAVKHNEFTVTTPMTVRIRLEGDSIVVVNELRPRRSRKPSSRVGLRNLNERSRLLTGRELQYAPSESHYQVSLPILRTSV